MPRLSHAQIREQKKYDPPYTIDEAVGAAFNWFREHGFPYRKLPLHVCMQEVNKLSQTKNASLRTTNAAYHVADTYHPHRFEGHAHGKISPVTAFNDDRRLTRAIKLAIEAGTVIDEDYFGTLSLVLGTQACSNFRPGFAAYIYRKYAPHNQAIVLDTSTGYGGRLVGAIASGVVGHYIGIDPSTKTHKGNLRLAEDLGWSDRVTLFNQPAEDVDPADPRLRKLIAQGIDLAFTSPPYFAKEEYTDEPTQSRLRYPEAKEWYRGFLKPMMRLQFAALRPGGVAIVNIADINYKNKRYPLSKWCATAGVKAGFVHKGTTNFRMSARFGANQDEEVAEEPVLIFEKPVEE